MINDNHDTCTYVNTFIGTYINTPTILFYNLSLKMGIFFENLISKVFKTIKIKSFLDVNLIFPVPKISKNSEKWTINKKLNGRVSVVYEVLSSYYCIDYTVRYSLNLRFWITSLTQWRKSSTDKLSKGHFCAFKSAFMSPKTADCRASNSIAIISSDSVHDQQWNSMWVLNKDVYRTSNGV